MIKSRRDQLQSKSKKHSDLKEKITSYMNNVAIDLFGYEKMVNKNAWEFAEKIGLETNTKPEMVFLKVFLPGAELKVEVFTSTRIYKKASVSKLVLFFMGASTPQIESKVADSIISFIEEYAKENGFDFKKLQFLISANKENGTLIQSYVSGVFQEIINLKILIKHFAK